MAPRAGLAAESPAVAEAGAPAVGMASQDRSALAVGGVEWLGAEAQAA